MLSVRALLAALAPLFFLAGCKLVLVVPEGGEVVLASGGRCAGGEQCEYSIRDTGFTESYTAVPARGYGFSHWRKRPAGFFGGVTEPEVQLSTTEFAGNAALEALLASDEVFYMEPVFEPIGDFVQLSGKVRYEMPAIEGNCFGLDLNNTELRPVRGATVQLLSDDGSRVLATGKTDEAGNYSLKAIPATRVFLRVRAELKRRGAPSWDVAVRDNTQRTGQPLSRRPMYWLDSPVFDTGSAGLRKNLTATTGWSGSSYSGSRSASPFAILDTVYQSMQTLLSVDPGIEFPSLNVFWGPRNSTAEGEIDLGEIGGAFYNHSQIFLTGKIGDDDDSFDSSVIAHEWMHYAIDSLARDDSIGGSHGTGDLLDMRLAFSEGAATALGGMALQQTQYCDTYWFNNRMRGNGESLESGRSGRNPGWFNETSVINLLYDLWDEAEDGSDTQSVGFAPIFEVIFREMPNSEAYTSLFTFADYLKRQPGVDASYVNALFAAENVHIDGGNQWGDGIPHPTGGGERDILPLYTWIRPGETRRLCSNRQFDPFGDGNKLSQFRYLRFQLSSPAAVTVTVAAVPPAPAVATDPEVQVFSRGELVGFGYSSRTNIETARTGVLGAGRHVMDITEWQFYDTDLKGKQTNPKSLPQRVCFDVSLQ